MEHKELKQQLLYTKDLEQILGLSSLTLRRWWMAGKFPKPVKLNDSLLSWHHSVIEKWINENMSIHPAASVI
jgi:prophage regulatory protein